MTSAARPTWNPAMGGYQNRDTASAPTKQVSARSLPSHTKLKVRQPGQNAPEDVNRRDLKKQLETAEETALKGKRIRDENEEGSRKRLQAAVPKNIDADDSDLDDDDDDSSGDKSDQDVDDEDDTAELLRELEKIKRERAEENQRQERERQELEETQRQEQIAIGNPLLNLPASSIIPKDFSVKRRWDDDVIFKNQAKGVEEQPKKRFINDMLRSDFHKKFMSKYVK